MAYKITDDCISCGACAGGCPVDAIAEGELVLYLKKKVQNFVEPFLFLW